jgi:phospholipid transport system substrate-binding protein
MTLLQPISRRILLVGGLLTAFPVTRGMAAPDPRVFINEFWMRSAPFMHSSTPAAQRLDGIRNLFQSSFDATPITEFVLGRYRWMATPTQIRDFFTLYQEYTVRTYGRRLSQLENAQLVLQNVRPYGAETVVSSNIVTPSGGNYRVDWYAVDRGGTYRISDLVIEGVSMKMTHRNEVARWIEVNGGSFASVLAVLRQEIGMS